MPLETRTVSPGRRPGTVETERGDVLVPPAGWRLLPPGDAALTRRVKNDGPSWTVIERGGRRRFSKGVWAPADRIDAIKAQLDVERADPAYRRKLDADRRRREREQVAYAKEFEAAIYAFLGFAASHDTLALMLADAIAAHAVPVGSGTVARTKRIPLERRAEAATIAWLRHQTTAYDHMTIERKKGKRREVRRMLAERSRRLLAVYRRGEAVNRDACPLRVGLARAGADPDLDDLPFEP